MTPSSPTRDWPRLRQAIEQALDLAPAERAAWLATRFSDSPALQAEAQRILQGLDNTDSPTERFAIRVRGHEARPGQWVGAQRLLRQIGTGGMGEIWEAERIVAEAPQRVAVKLLAYASGLAFAERLQAERRVLARLSHPNICGLLDAGVDAQGRPYLVLELVHGVSLESWCVDGQPALRERLQLLLEICDAVAYAHAHLVIHRDLKPSNVLVGDSGRVKLLDFGIARILDDQLPSPSGATQLLTPAYASPEQARGEPVGTAADIYALGVILYELICGHAPYALDGLDPASLIECLQNPRHPSPSQRLRQSGSGALKATAWQPVSEGLDAVVARAMNPDPERRYRSVEALAEDLRLWLDGRPVRARPDHWSYRLRCFLRRNALASGATAVILILTIAFSLMLWQRYQLERAALAEAERERRLSMQTSDFLVQLFSSADPDAIDPQRVDLKTLLDRGSAALLSGGVSDADLTAGLSARMARVYVSLGLFDDAERLLAPWRVEPLPGIAPVRRAELLEAAALARHGTGDSAAAEMLLRQALQWRKQLSDSTKGDESAAARARSLYQLAVVLRDRASYAEAEQLLLQAETIQQQAEPDALLRTRIQLAALTWLRGDLAAAQDRYLQALEQARPRLADDHPDLARALVGLGLLAHRRGEFALAARHGEEALAIQVRSLGRQHPTTAQTMSNLGALYMDAGDYALASERLQQALQIQQPRRSELRPAISNTFNNLGLVNLRQGQPDRAREWFEQALVDAEQAYGQQHPQVATIADNLGLALTELDQPYAAEQRFHQALAARQAVLPEGHPHLAFSHHHLGLLALQAGKLQLADQHLQLALQIRIDKLGAGHPLSATSRAALADLQRERGELTAAIEGYRQALGSWKAAEGDHANEMARNFTSLAEALRSSGVDAGEALAAAQAQANRLTVRQLAELRPRWEELAAELASPGAIAE